MKVTVILTSFNYGRYLENTLGGIFDQDYKGPMEIIAVDDGSTDDSVAVLKSFGDRVKVIEKKNGGQPSALNAGFKAATGDIICFLDSDDWWAPAKVSRVVKCFGENPGIGMVHHYMEVMDGMGRAAGPSGEPAPKAHLLPAALHPGDGDMRRSLLVKGLPWIFAPSSGLSFTREALASVMPLPEELKFDADALTALPLAALYPVRFIPEALGKFRIHVKSAGATLQMDRGPGRSERAEVQIKHQKAFWDHTGAVLERAGKPSGLDPRMSWNYLKYLSAHTGRPPVVFLPGALSALMKNEIMTPGEKLASAARLAGRALERSVTGNYRKKK